MTFLEDLARYTAVGTLLERLQPFALEHIDHWKQGEFHHDLVVRLKNRPDELAGPVLVISTNCNGGVKELINLATVPERWALWNYRCPDNPEFEGTIYPVLGLVRTHHWYDPHELLKPDARSEYKPEHRRRQRGGGWVPVDSEEE